MIRKARLKRINMISRGSVSYTHLDVYKRQINMRDAKLSQLVVTNTIPIADPMKSMVEVISVAQLLADAIVRIHEGRSISTMFR